MDDDPIGELLRRLSSALLGAAVLDLVDEYATGFGRRFPRTFGVARIVVGGALLLVGPLEAGSSLAVLVYFVYSGEGLTSLFLLLPLALGAGITLWGIGMMRRGWAGCRSPAEQAPWIPADPSVPSVSREPLER